jgi:arginyl-tRNA synthetase
MEQLLSLLEKKVTEAIKDAFGSGLEEKSLSAEILACSQENFGHYQCNNPLKLSKALKKNPREVAEAIVERLNTSAKPYLSQLEVAGPGFINITLAPEFLSQKLDQMLADPKLGIAQPHNPQRVIVEFSSPNIAKELHVGHLRSTIIGESIARVFEFLGHDVLRLNHVGDWGTQFGMLISFIKENHYQAFREGSQVDLYSLMMWYKESKKKFDEDADFKKRAQQEVVKLQGRDQETIQDWERICSLSRLALQEIYDLLDVTLIERGESFYNPYLKDVVADLEQKGMIQVSDGAKCVFLEGFANREGEPFPLMVQKSDGGFNYDTTDLAAVRYRVGVDKADRIIVVVDMGQSLHFQLVFKAAEKAGYYDSKKVRMDHVGFGLVLGPDGKKFKTRSGNTEKLIDLLHGAVDQASKLIQEKIPDINHDELRHLAENIGIGAVKYADLSCHRQKDYTFSYDKMLKFEGNTAVFLMYSYVRIMGIKRKVNADIQSVQKNHRIELKHPSEISLGFHLLRFNEILDVVANELLPNRLTDYLYDLSSKFNAFFRDCRVEGALEQASRLLLCEVSGRVLKQGLSLLGIKTVDRM